MRQPETDTTENMDTRASIRRREFLCLVGASFTALGLSQCRFQAPHEKVVPYLQQPEEITPGVANWYASTCGGCSASCGVLVKNRDGRPIKLEGNPNHPHSQGGVCARGQATVLDLYDSERLQSPLADGKATTWDTLDAAVTERLAAIKKDGGRICVLSSTVTSPTLQAAIARFLQAYPDAQHVTYDALSSSAIIEAHRISHDEYLLPFYRFDRAKVVVAFDADFLGTWIAPVEFTKRWSLNRKLTPDRPVMSWHVQFEARMSVTGANADLRVPLAPSSQFAALWALAQRVVSRLGQTNVVRLPQTAQEPHVDPATLDRIADELVAAGGRSLVVSGSDDVNAQLVVNTINALLDSYGTTLDVGRPSLQKQGRLREFDNLLGDMQQDRVTALVLLDANPAYDHARAQEFSKALSKVSLTVSLAGRKDETASLVQYVAPDHHPLESWSDAHPRVGVYSLQQPTIAPLYDSRSAIESLLAWAGPLSAEVASNEQPNGSNEQPNGSTEQPAPENGTASQDRDPQASPPTDPWTAYEFLRTVWQQKIFTQQAEHEGFETFWNSSLHDGVCVIEEERLPDCSFNSQSVAEIQAPSVEVSEGAFELVVYPSISLGDGRQANNPWLQELPDPVSKTSWGNFVSLSPQAAQQLGVIEGQVVELSAKTAAQLPAGSGGENELPKLQLPKAPVRLPVQIQPGLPDNVVAAALGYGRTHAGKIAANYPLEKMLPIDKVDEERLKGADLYPFLRVASVSVSPTSETDGLAKSQTGDHLTVPLTGKTRPIVRETTLDEYVKNPRALSKEESHESTLWPEHEYTGYKWAMAIDTNRCTGCSACVIGCQAENNVPVVGKAEARNRRALHWIRIDRFYSGSEAVPDENPEVAFQPMLCQHCDNAPCETVCPVLATVHSTEGLNMQVYNRCVGTRYCENNCPYKVRRFNWFDYARIDPLQNLVLNPDVAVRSRGVMEKCSFCTQRIAEAKAQAKSEDRQVRDGEIIPACVQSCPADAIVFGDMNDPNSQISKAVKDPRTYTVLGELHTRPSVYYQMKVRNQKETPRV